MQPLYENQPDSKSSSLSRQQALGRLRLRHGSLESARSSLAALGVVVSVLAAATDASSAVYRCVGAEDRVHFEQFGCPAHTLQEPVELAEFNLITATELNDLERTQLARLESRLEAARRSSTRERGRRSAAAQKDRKASERLCAQARSNLAQLAAQRRDGYAASEDRALSAQEKRWEVAESEHC